MKTKIQDIHKQRIKRRRKAFLSKLLFVFILIFLVFIIYLFKNNILNFISDMASTAKYEMKYRNSQSEGKFPVQLDESSNYSILNIGNKVCVLSDSLCNFYNDTGDNIYSDQHQMSNPIMKKNSNIILLYDRGAYKLKVIKNYKTVFEKKLSEKILYANISSNGYVCVVTESDKYFSVMKIFNENGEEIFYTTSGDKIINVDFTANNNGCIASLLSLKGGNMFSTLTKYNFNSEQFEWESFPTKALPIQIYLSQDDSVIMLADEKICFYDKAGIITKEYLFSADLKNFDVDNSNVAVYLKNESLRENYVILASKQSDVSIFLNEEVEDIIVEDENLYVLTKTKLFKYDLEGNLIQEYNVNFKFEEFVVVDDYAYLIGDKQLYNIYLK